MAKRLRYIRSLVLWIVWLALVIIWLATLGEQWTEGRHSPAILAIVVLGLLLILYFAEGMELAVTDLLDKEPAQLRDSSVRALLSQIQHRSGFFYAQRQVFVVVIISIVSLTTSYRS